MDSTGHEIFLLDNFNVDFMPDANANNTNKLKDIFATYGLEQLINEPTRVTSNSSTLIDLCVTNTATKIILGFSTWVSLIIRSSIWRIKQNMNVVENVSSKFEV